MRRPVAGLQGSAAPSPPRPAGAAAARQGSTLPPRHRPHRARAAPLGDRRRPPGLLGHLLPQLNVRFEGFSLQARARPDPLPHCFPAPASGRRPPSVCVPAARASPPEYKGPRSRGHCSPTGLWVLKLPFSFWRARGLPRTDTHPPEAKAPGLGSASSPHPQVLGAGPRPRTARVQELETEPGVHGRRRGRLPRNACELWEPMSERMWGWFVFFSPRF